MKTQTKGDGNLSLEKILGSLKLGGFAGSFLAGTAYVLAGVHGEPVLNLLNYATQSQMTPSEAGVYGLMSLWISGAIYQNVMNEDLESQ